MKAFSHVSTRTKFLSSFVLQKQAVAASPYLLGFEPSNQTPHFSHSPDTYPGKGRISLEQENRPAKIPT
jgi:hypothetical protein